MQIRDRAGVQLQLHSFFTSALGGVGRRRHALAALPPGKSTGTPCRKRCVCSRVGLVVYGEEKKNLLPPARNRTCDRPARYQVATPTTLSRSPLDDENPFKNSKSDEPHVYLLCVFVVLCGHCCYLC